MKAEEMIQTNPAPFVGTVVKHWFGDQLPNNPANAGEIPGGYEGRPLYKQWIRARHEPGHFAFGPYEKINGEGSFKVRFFLEATNRLNPEDLALGIDVVDYTTKTPLLEEVKFHVKDLPNSSSFVLYTPEMNIIKDHAIESRVTAYGGADLKLWEIRWEIDAS